MRRWLREPLLHFAVLGVGLFALDAFLGQDTVEAGDQRIVVTAGRVENLAALFAKTRQRPPTFEELKALVDDFILEEALYREGVALGLDRDDTVVRRRVRLRMEYVIEDLVDQAEPSEAELQAWLDERSGEYGDPLRLGFRQVFLSPDQRGEAVHADAERLLAALRSEASADAAGLGDPSLLEHVHTDVPADRVALQFGGDFAAALTEASPGEWLGPLESPYGLHLVRLDSRTERAPPTLEDVRAPVERDWLYARREEVTRRYHDELLERYSVSVEWPEARPEGAESAPAR